MQKKLSPETEKRQCNLHFTFNIVNLKYWFLACGAVVHVTLSALPPITLIDFIESGNG